MIILQLASEIIVNILRFAPAHDIRRCQQTCRQLREVIVESLLLQYILTLERTGYQPPLRTRPDLDYAQMIQVLRNNRDGWRLCAELADPSLIEIATPNVVFSVFVDGVLAYMSEERTGRGPGESRTLPTIYFHQLASINKGTEYKHWRHDLGHNVVDIAIQPEIDLLVLLTFDDLPGQGGSNHIHLRTMSTNDPHPLAASPVLDLHVSDMTRDELETEDHVLQIYGRMISIYYDGTVGGRRAPRFHPTIWDWVAGTKIAHLKFPDPREYSMAFISERLFVVPQCTKSDAHSRLTVLGCLEVYRLPLIGHLRPSVKLILPELPEACNWPFVSVARNNTVPTIQTIQQETLARVYELAPENRRIRLRVSAVDFRPASPRYRVILQGYMYISVDSLLKLLCGANGDDRDYNEPLEIPWCEWASCTSWVSLPTRGSDWVSTWGQRCAFLRLSGMVRIGDPDMSHYDLYVMDFDQNRNRDKAQPEPHATGPSIEPDREPGNPALEADWEGDVFRGALSLSTIHFRKLIIEKERLLRLRGSDPANALESTLYFRKIMLDDEHIAILADKSNGVTPFGLLVYKM